MEKQGKKRQWSKIQMRSHFFSVALATKTCESIVKKKISFTCCHSKGKLNGCTLYSCLKMCAHCMQMDLITFSILTKYFNYIKKTETHTYTSHKIQTHMEKT